MISDVEAVLAMPMPEADAEGFVDLFDIVEAARAATGYPLVEPDTGRWWRTAHDERMARAAAFETLMAAWHGLTLAEHHGFVPDETVVLASDRHTSLVAQLLRTPRGVWLWGLHADVDEATGGVPLGPEVTQAYASRAVALQDAAREAHARVRQAAPRYVRILASLHRQANVP